jgi:Nif-specific regulatory protein
MEAFDRHTGIGRAALILADSASQDPVVAASYGVQSSKFVPKLGEGVAGRVLQNGRPMVIPAVRQDPMALSELADPVEWAEMPWCLVSVPVSLEGKQIGTLSAYFRGIGQDGFAERLRVVERVAELVAEAIRSPAKPAPTTPPPEPAERRPRTVFEYANMIGSSAAMRQVYEQIGQVARTNATALLRGESGTGKELVAQAIHGNSPRSSMPFVKVNCAALPEALFESELFGHERGSFTGAHSRKKGRFELAQGGTLFLDEVGEITLTTQAKLLRVLQSREFERVGGTETLRTDVRIVTATNKDMERAVQEGSFREDLYYRLNVFSITLPSLRNRRADIPGLAEYFLAKYAREHTCRVTRLSSAALDVLCQYDWPGNVRELENVIERAVVVCDGSVIREQHFPESLRSAGPAPSRNATLSEAVAELERRMITEALSNERGNVARAARALGTSERVIRYKAGKYNIDAGSFRSS